MSGEEQFNQWCRSASTGELVGRVVEDEFDELCLLDSDDCGFAVTGDDSDVVEVSEVVVERAPA